MTIIYIYDPKTGAYETEFEAKIDPRTGLELLPSPTHKSRTLVVPPDPEIDKVRRFNRETQTWSQEIDWRGRTVFRKSDGSAVILNEFFDFDLKDEYTPIAPPSEYYDWDETTGNWIEDTARRLADEAEAARKQEIEDDAATQDIIDKMVSKTNAEIDAFVQNATSTQLKTIVAGILKVIAFKLG